MFRLACARHMKHLTLPLTPSYTTTQHRIWPKYHTLSTNTPNKLHRRPHYSTTLLSQASSSSSSGHTDSLTQQQPAADPQPPTSTGRMILTDAMALLYRSHFAFPGETRLRNPAGEDTTVLFGFLSTLLNLLELQPPPTHLVVVLDASGKNFRHEIYPGYKGQRPETPPEIKAAVPMVLELLAAMGIPCLRVPGVEADDVIGTLATRGVKEGLAVAIASPDKDFFQLLQPGLVLLRPPAKVKDSGPDKSYKYALLPYTTQHFIEDTEGLHPNQFVDMLAMAGDASDNVPGIPRVGKKIATKYLLEYGTLDGLYENKDKLKPGATTRQVVENEAAARLSLALVSIRTDLDMPSVTVPLDNFVLRPPSDGGQAAFQLMQKYNFNKHVARVKQLWNV